MRPQLPASSFEDLFRSMAVEMREVREGYAKPRSREAVDGVPQGAPSLAPDETSDRVKHEALDPYMLSASVLATRLTSLPQELFDHIYELTFTVSSTRRTETSAKQDIKMLQVSRTTRAELAPMYFAGGIQIKVLSYTWGELYLPRWIDSFPQAYKTFVHEFECLLPNKMPESVYAKDLHRAMKEDHFLGTFQRSGFSVMNRDHWRGRVQIVFLDD